MIDETKSKVVLENYFFSGLEASQVGALKSVLDYYNVPASLMTLEKQRIYLERELLMRLQTGPIILLVSDLVRAKNYYMNMLGCEHDDCGHTTREGLFILMHEAENQRDVRPISGLEGGPTWDILVYTSDHEELIEEFRSRGANIYSEITVSETGWKEFIVEDLDGYRIGFGGKSEE